ncbi:hypothetical protein [uncultured Eubacterium sp.]|uniref:hypothetical protein n=1 Tax=uncultured Eubacterium sp. TaxID=165185 RepID=UPI0025FB0EAB|nr:hypothetical protein [uncultured Eubacterium sp.]
MILDVVQVSKDLFAASFVINRGNVQVGDFSLKGSLGSMEANITGKLFEHSFEMRFGKSDIIEMAHPFRPYIIDKNGVQNGIVYQTKFNGGLFKKFDYHQMKKAGITYDLFPIGLGTDGSKSPIYQDNTQIAQIEKDCVVYNDLHTYKIFAQDEFSGEIAVLFAIYMYINAGYKPGKKDITSTVKVVTKTTNKLLLEKYNSDFTKYIEA